MAGRKLINLWQSKEERQAKYWLARSLGANSYHAGRMRDWRLSKIERRYNLPITDYYDDPMARVAQHNALQSKSSALQ